MCSILRRQKPLKRKTKRQHNKTGTACPALRRAGLPESGEYMYQTALVNLPLLVRESGPTKRISTPESVKEVCADMADLAQESVHILCLNTKNGLIQSGRVMITLGVVDASLLHPREVFRPAIVNSAAAIILVHNHPSGDMTASAEDINITRQLVEAGKIVDIKILDHCILGRNEDGEVDCLSMRENGIVAF